MLLFKKLLHWTRGEIHVGSVKKFTDLAEDRDVTVSVEIQLGTTGPMLHTGSVGKIGLWTYTAVASMPISQKKTVIFSEQVASHFGSKRETSDAKERDTAEANASLAAKNLVLKLVEQMPNAHVQLLKFDS